MAARNSSHTPRYVNSSGGSTDTDNTGALIHIELTSVLDSLGSTLSAETINSFFTRNEKKPDEDELTVDEVIRCLEMQVGRSLNEKKRVVVPA